MNPVGFNENTPNRLVIDAGAVYMNVEFDEQGFPTPDTGTNLGATAEANELAIEIEWMEIPINGVKSRVRGLRQPSSINAQLTTNLKEVTADNLKKGMGAADVESGTDFDKVEPRSVVKDEDYIDNIVLVARYGAGGDYIVVVLDNALSGEGFTMSFEDDGQAVIPTVFQAHLDAADVGSNKVPFRIFTPNGTLAS